MKKAGVLTLEYVGHTICLSTHARLDSLEQTSASGRLPVSTGTVVGTPRVPHIKGAARAMSTQFAPHTSAEGLFGAGTSVRTTSERDHSGAEDDFVGSTDVEPHCAWGQFLVGGRLPRRATRLTGTAGRPRPAGAAATHDRANDVDNVQRTLLAVHAHPDDESITMGGTLARYSAEGVRTVVVTCTSGDLGEVLVQNERGESVASLRDRELRSACDVLGVSRLVQLGYGDSGMPGDPLNHRQGAFWAADLDEAASRLQEVIDEEHPDVIATYDDTGGYGHPDHLKSHLVTVEAVRRLGWQPRLFFVRFPLSWSREFVTALRAEGILTPGSAPSGADAGPDVHEIGVPDALVTTRIDVRSYVAIKRRALQCYASQLPPEHWLSRMPDALAGRFWAEEVYSLDGPAPPPPTDLFCEP